MSKVPLIMQLRGEASGNAVYQFAEGSLTQVGGFFGTNTTNTFPATHYENYVIQWQSGIYALAPEDGIYKWTPGQDWTSVHSFVNPDTSAGNEIGLYPVIKNNEHVLATAYVSATSTTDIRLVYLSKDDTATETTDIDLSLSLINEALQNVFKHQNKIYFYLNPGSTSPRIGIIDPESDGISIVNLSTPFNFGTTAMCIHPNGNIYVSGRENGTQDLSIGRLQGSSYMEDFVITAATHGNTRNLRQMMGVDENNNLVLTDGDTAIRMFYMPVNPDGSIDTATDIASTILGFTSHAGQETNDKWWWFTDVEETSGSGIHYFFYSQDAAAAGSSISMYRWNGSGVAASFLGAGADGFEYAMATSYKGGGHRLLSATGELTWTFIDATIINSNVDIRYQLNGPQGTNSIAVGLMYGIDGEAIKRTATLTSTSHGSLSGNNIIGQTAFNADRTYTARWAAAQDGLDGTNKPIITARIFSV